MLFWSRDLVDVSHRIGGRILVSVAHVELRVGIELHYTRPAHADN